MESLESKLDRLTPGERREVEDFVDFLIQRAEGMRAPAPVVPAFRDTSAPARSIAPPLITADPVVPDEPVAYPAPAPHEIPAAPELIQPAASPAPQPPLVLEIETDDGLLDYGRFEKGAAAARAPLPPSPADAAIQKVKRKLIQKSEPPKNQMLDWID
ncbi:hypothetical protein [Methanoregula sp. UBA64]|jgi:hypothetical protein|uniref:hypothetical protein n=1 Tax=Methanoregula sp. UBA64 TaxID=1915554 RepID=UPI0025F73D1F|nr:hypothetical protein [Methanoregula sp. UBA64]